VTAVLESGPLALLVCAHVGTPLPDQPMAAEAEGEQTEDPFLKQVKARMESLASLEPLLEVLREVSGAAATSVEFVPHEVWLGNPEAFAIKVRNEDVENKLYLLENLAAIPEETGVRRAVHPAPEGQPEPAAATETVAAPVPDIFPLTWAEREGWAVRTLREMVPENLVQDSLTASCKALTLSTGLWARAPQRIMGPFIEAEIGAFLETLQLPYRGTAAEEAAAIAELESQAAEEGKDAAPAPVLVALGGGGFGAGSAGEEELMKKLELLIGLSRLADNEKGGVHVALGGELACCVLSGVLGIRMGRTGSVAPEGAIGAALREALLEVMRTGVTISLPVDLICEAAEGEEVEFDESTAGPVFSLAASLQAVGKRPPISLGYYKGSECFLMLDPDTGSLDLKTCRFGEEAPATAAPQPAEGTEVVEDGAEAPTEPAGIPNLPDTWTVRDIGQATVECLRIRLRRSRGSLWNGSLGCCEDERWQRGTRDFLGMVEGRLLGVGEDEEDEDEEEEEEDEEDEEGDEEDEDKPKREAKPPKERRVDFEVGLVIGRDSRRLAMTLTEQPASISFISGGGEGLVQIFRGVPLPGMLACLKNETKGAGS